MATGTGTGTPVTETATTDDVAVIRRYCGLSDSDATYTDTVIEAYMDEFPLVDVDGYDPDDSTWTETYDLHAVAERIWQEKAALIADKFDFAADGATYGLSSKHTQYMKQARYHGARKSPSAIEHRTEPRITADS